MRNTFIFTLLVSLLFSPSWSETLSMDDLVMRNNTYYKKFSDKPFSGKISEDLVGKFKKGKKDGLWLRYWTNGQLFSKGKYSKGVKVGNWEFYHSNGKLETKGKCVKGIEDLKVGSWIRFSRKGVMLLPELPSYEEFMKDSKILSYDEYFEKNTHKFNYCGSDIEY